MNNKSNNHQSSNISENIKRIRLEKGISQDRLSKLADLSLNTVVNVESGVNPNPTVETLIKIADGLNVEVGILLGGGGERHSKK